jgi:hypothetical protein
VADFGAFAFVFAAGLGLGGAFLSDENCARGVPTEAGQTKALALAQAQAKEEGEAKNKPPRDVRGFSHLDLRKDKVDSCTTFTFQEENDTYGSGSDRYFTQGLQLRWTSAEATNAPLFTAIKSTFDESGLWAKGDRSRASFGVGQNMYTPANTKETRPIPQDRPYAGWAYLTFGATTQRPGPKEWGGDILDGIEASIGVVGPGSAAKWAQTERHRGLGIDLPAGWGNQIDNEIGLVLYREWQWRTPEIVPGRAVDAPRIADFAPHAGLAAGNVFTYGAVGGIFRLGFNLPDDFGPSGIKPGLPGSSFSVPTDGFSIYAFVGGEQRAVVRNIFLDGGVIGDDPRVDKKLWVHDVYSGLAIQYGALRFAFAEVMRSPEFDGQSKRHQYGALTFSWRF